MPRGSRRAALVPGQAGPALGAAEGAGQGDQPQCSGDDFEVVGECDDGDLVEQAVAVSRPDVVVMDMRMKREDGAEATRRLRARDGSPPCSC